VVVGAGCSFLDRVTTNLGVQIELIVLDMSLLKLIK
jgi:hypothetical protein